MVVKRPTRLVTARNGQSDETDLIVGNDGRDGHRAAFAVARHEQGDLWPVEQCGPHVGESRPILRRDRGLTPPQHGRDRTDRIGRVCDDPTLDAGGFGTSQVVPKGSTAATLQIGCVILGQNQYPLT